MITFMVFCLLVYAVPYIAIIVFIIGFIYGLLDK